ncbi:hypothetical protein VNI00_008973 [Paramarasmius palmivorus]|uniref:HMG domain-containing protein n=1 Tax=Paramarasmius palmivorus TaxID=297713 RepID=A0AAW0CNZ3_9AGAR
MAPPSDDDEPFILDPLPNTPDIGETYPGHLNRFIPSPVRSYGPKRARTRNTSAKRRKTSEGTDHSLRGTQANSGTISTIPEVESGQEMSSPMDSGEHFGVGVLGLCDDIDNSEDAYQEFLDLIEDECIAFVHVATRVYVVEGFDEQRREGTGVFYHFEARQRGDGLDLNCQCHSGKTDCFHRRFYREYREERFSLQEAHLELDGDVVCFSRVLIDMEKDIWTSRFSVASGTASESGRSRAIVSYEGTVSGGGKWHCSKDKDLRGTCCTHMGQAKQLLDLITGNDESEASDGTPDAAKMYMVDGMNAGGASENAISYLPIMPPLWASLPEDENLYPYPNPNEVVPEVLKLDVRSRSLCGSHFFNPEAPKLVRECTVYTLTHAVHRKIELQNCPGCPRRRKCFIGPEPRDIGLFNYNNSALFTHELMNELTSRYTSSETPFTAFVLVLGRLYRGRGCRFVSEDMFRSAWFAFATIQRLSNDMSCPECGEYPSTVIWDGVTISFSKRHLQETLKPPTTIASDAPIRKRGRVNKQQWLPHGKEKTTPTRKALMNWLKKWADYKPSERSTCRVVAEIVEGNEESDDEDLDVSAKQNDITEAERREGELAEIQRQLTDMGARPVADLLREVYGIHGKVMHWRLRKRYKMLFEQIAADESVLQMMNQRALPSLKAFVERPCLGTISLLTNIPVLMLILENMWHGKQDMTLLLGLSRWMISRVETVLTQLKSGPDLPLESLPVQHEDSEDWQKVSVNAAQQEHCTNRPQ